jgi:hypothetical protein
LHELHEIYVQNPCSHILRTFRFYVRRRNHKLAEGGVQDFIDLTAIGDNQLRSTAGLSESKNSRQT